MLRGMIQFLFIFGQFDCGDGMGFVGFGVGFFLFLDGGGVGV